MSGSRSPAAAACTGFAGTKPTMPSHTDRDVFAGSGTVIPGGGVRFARRASIAEGPADGTRKKGANVRAKTPPMTEEPEERQERKGAQTPDHPGAPGAGDRHDEVCDRERNNRHAQRVHPKSAEWLEGRERPEQPRIAGSKGKNAEQEPGGESDQ